MRVATPRGATLVCSLDGFHCLGDYRSPPCAQIAAFAGSSLQGCAWPCLPVQTDGSNGLNSIETLPIISMVFDAAPVVARQTHGALTHHEFLEAGSLESLTPRARAVDPCANWLLEQDYRPKSSCARATAPRNEAGPPHGAPIQIWRLTAESKLDGGPVARQLGCRMTTRTQRRSRL